MAEPSPQIPAPAAGRANPWHIALHVLPAGARTAGALNWAGQLLPTLEIDLAQLAPFSVSFEQALNRLERLPRLFIEPDGALVWVGHEAGRNWQLDGVVYDRAGSVLYVEIKGRCPRPALEQLLAAFGWPHTPLAVQLVQHGAWLTLETFLQRLVEQDPRK